MRKRYLGFSVFVIVILMLMTFAEAYQLNDKDNTGDDKKLLANVDNDNQRSDGVKDNVDNDEQKLLANVDDVKSGDVKSGDEIKDSREVGDNKNGLVDSLINDFKGWIGFFGSVLNYGGNANKITGNSITGNAVAASNEYPENPLNPGSRFTEYNAERPFPFALAFRFYYTFHDKNSYTWGWNPANPVNSIAYDEAGYNNPPSDLPHVPASITALDVPEIKPVDYERFLASSRLTALGLPGDYFTKTLDKGILDNGVNALFPPENMKDIRFRDNEKKLITTYLDYVLKRIDNLQKSSQQAIFFARATKRSNRNDIIDFNGIPADIRDPRIALPITAWRQMILDKLARNEDVPFSVIENYELAGKVINLPAFDEYRREVEDAIKNKAMYLAILNDLRAKRAMFDANNPASGLPLSQSEKQISAISLWDSTRDFLNPDNPRGPFKSFVNGYYIALEGLSTGFDYAGPDSNEPCIAARTCLGKFNFNIERAWIAENKDRNLWKGWDFDLSLGLSSDDMAHLNFYAGATRSTKDVSKYLDEKIEEYQKTVDMFDIMYPMLKITYSNGNPKFNGINTDVKLKEYFDEIEAQAIQDLSDSQDFVKLVFQNYVRGDDYYSYSVPIMQKWAELVYKTPVLDRFIVPNYKVFAGPGDTTATFIASLFMPVGAANAAFALDQAKTIRAVRQANNYFSVIQMMDEFNIGTEHFGEIGRNVGRQVAIAIAFYVATLGTGAILASFGFDVSALFGIIKGAKGLFNARSIGQEIVTLSLLGFNIYGVGMMLANGFEPVWACAGSQNSRDFHRTTMCANVAGIISGVVLSFFAGAGGSRVLHRQRSFVISERNVLEEFQRRLVNFNPQTDVEYVKTMFAMLGMQRVVENGVAKYIATRMLKSSKRGFVAREPTGSLKTVEVPEGIVPKTIDLPVSMDADLSNIIMQLYRGRIASEPAAQAAEKPVSEQLMDKGAKVMEEFPNYPERPLVPMEPAVAQTPSPVPRAVRSSVDPVPKIDLSTDALIKSVIEDVKNFAETEAFIFRTRGKAYDNREIVKKLDEIIDRLAPKIRALEERARTDRDLLNYWNDELSRSVKPADGDTEAAKLLELNTGNDPNRGEGIMVGDMVATVKKADGSVQMRTLSRFMFNAKSFTDSIIAKLRQLQRGEFDRHLVVYGEEGILPYIDIKLRGADAMLEIPKFKMPRELLVDNNGEIMKILTSGGLFNSYHNPLPGATTTRTNPGLSDRAAKLLGLRLKAEADIARDANRFGVGSAPFNQAVKKFENEIFAPFLENMYKKGYLRILDAEARNMRRIFQYKLLQGSVLLVDSGDFSSFMEILWLKYLMRLHRYRNSQKGFISLNLDGKITDVFLDIDMSIYRLGYLGSEPIGSGQRWGFLTDNQRIIASTGSRPVNSLEYASRWLYGAEVKKLMPELAVGVELGKELPKSLLIKTPGDTKIVETRGGEEIPFETIEGDKLRVWPAEIQGNTNPGYTINGNPSEGLLSLREWRGVIMIGQGMETAHGFSSTGIHGKDITATWEGGQFSRLLLNGLIHENIEAGYWSGRRTGWKPDIVADPNGAGLEAPILPGNP